MMRSVVASGSPLQRFLRLIGTTFAQAKIGIVLLDPTV
jgi:hypothetical protein